MRLMGQLMQDAGFEVIPIIRTLGDDTIEWCLEGIEPGGVYAVSTVGVAGSGSDFKELCRREVTGAIERLKPESLILYGTDIGYEFHGVPVKHIEARKWRVDEHAQR